MAGGDGTNPPVLFVVGTAGAGKSTLVTAFQRWSRFLEVDALAVNLDPGAERVHYDAEFDVRDLVSLSEVMDEYDLGPNGAQIHAADLVAAQAYDIHDELEGLSGDLLVIDTPGGRLIHSGDFKLDPTPIVGEAFDPELFAEVSAGARMILQVHDELVFEVPEADVDAVSAFVRDTMVTAFPLGDVPVVVEVGIADNWLDAH